MFLDILYNCEPFNCFVVDLWGSRVFLFYTLGQMKHCISRKAYGGAYDVMFLSNYAWPGADIAVMGAWGGGGILRRPDMEENIAEYTDRFADPTVTVQRGYIDDVNEPCDTAQHVRGFAFATHEEHGYY
jgi:acetyl-CoA carboxylase carboxyltransferase component